MMGVFLAVLPAKCFFTEAFKELEIANEVVAFNNGLDEIIVLFSLLLLIIISKAA